jgi:hypothetical protein
MSLAEQQDPMSIFFIFLYALKSPESRRQYSHRFKMFLDFLKLLGTIEEQAIEFLTKARQNPQWAQDNLMQDFIHLTPKGQKLLKGWLAFLSAL